MLSQEGLLQSETEHAVDQKAALSTGIFFFPSGVRGFSIEDNDQLRQRLQHRLIITDDNMGTEWLA